MDIERARSRIGPHVRHTPVERAPGLEAGGAEVYLKLDNLQVTGSFKARGAVNKLLSLTEAARDRGVLAASSGNHGAAVAYAAQALGCRASVCVPTYASETKIAAIRSYGATVTVVGDDCVETEIHARGLAADRGQTYISPYNDREVVCGQGTLGAELAEQVPDLDAVFVAVGGGGLIGGVGAYLKALSPRVEIVACSPARSPALHACLEAGERVDVTCDATLSDATAGGVEEGAITVPLCLEVVDTSLLVAEGAIREGMRYLLETHHTMVEGAAGVVVAAWRQVAPAYANKRVALVICGANVSAEVLRSVLS
ncbi:MAG: threonine/serine dehydratase [Myxococcota bacterium]|nr:threonine/serine dehydratase [Myxococcota bacterium]